MSSVIAKQAPAEQPEAPVEQLEASTEQLEAPVEQPEAPVELTETLTEQPEAPVEQAEVSTWTYTDYTCSYAVDQAGNIRDASTFTEDELHQIQHA